MLSQVPHNQTAPVVAGCRLAALLAVAVFLPLASGPARRLAAQNPEPATANAALRVIDLRELPRLPGGPEFEIGPTSLSYMAAEGVPEAAAFYHRELESRGWKSLPQATPPTAQYSDELFARDGFSVRVAIGDGGAGSSSVSVTSLGNFDVRKLPVMPGARHMAEATAVNASHESAKSLTETVSALTAAMQSAGWQVCSGFGAGLPEVDHYRSVSFRKNAVRVMLGVTLNPQQAGGPPIAFYLSEPMMPFDVPAGISDSPLRLDVSAWRASQETSLDRKGIRQLVEQNAGQFGWNLPPSVELDRFASGETPWIVVPLDDAEGLFMGLSEQNRVYSFAAQRMKLPRAQGTTRQTAPAGTAGSGTGNIAGTAVPPAMPDPMAGLGAEISQAVDAELQKALGSLGTTPAGPERMAELQSRAAGLLQNMQGNRDVTPGLPGEPDNAADSLMVAEDEPDATADAIQVPASSCHVRMDGQDHELRHALAYARYEHGDPVRVVIFSDQPLDAGRLKELLEQRKSVWGHDLTRPGANFVLVRSTGKSSASIQFAWDGFSGSTNGSTEVDRIRYVNGRLGGPFRSSVIELGRHSLTVEMDVNSAAIAALPLSDD